MTAISWKNPYSGNWNVAADWSTNTVPTLSDDVTIAVTTSNAYIVSITSADVAKSLTFNPGNGLAELLENAGSLTLSGALAVENGLVVLNRANTIGGGVSLTGGVLSVGNAGAVGTNTLYMTGGELLGTANETLANAFQIEGTPTFAAAHGTTLDIGSGGWYFTSSALDVGAPGEDGTVVAHAAAGVEGEGIQPQPSQISGGTLKAGDSSLGELLYNPVLYAGAILDIAGFNVGLNGLSGAGTVKDSGAAATLTLSNSNFAGSITGAISLVVDGTGDPTTLTGANTYTGTTTINTDAGPSGGGAGDGLDGILVLGTGGSIGSGAVDDENEFLIDSASAVTLNNVISGLGSLTQEGSGTTSINNADNSYAGGTTITAGTLAVGNVGALGSGPVIISGGELLGTANEDLANVVAMSGSLTIAAAHGTTLEFGSNGWGFNEAPGNTLYFGAPGQDGTVIWHTANIGTAGGVAFSGTAIEVRSGTLKAGDSELVFWLQFSPRVTVDAGATLDIGLFDENLDGASLPNLTGAGTVTGTFGGSELVLSGANFAGTITGGINLVIKTSSLFSGLINNINSLGIDDLATLTNTGTFNMLGGDDIVGSATATFVNDGLFKTASEAANIGGGHAFIELNFVNNGTLTVLHGDMDFAAGFTNNGVVNGIISANQGEIIVSATASHNAADFNGDGTSDILYRNDATGDTGFYAMVNGVNTGWHDVGASSTAYKVVGAGDFGAEGNSDVAYRNSTTGDTGFYSIVNGANTGWTDIGLTSTAYSVVATGDFEGANGGSYLLFRNNATGDAGFYTYSDAHSTFSWVDIGASSTAYSVVGTGDFDGNTDILFRNNATGDTGFYSIVDGANAGWHDVGVSNTAYSVVGVGNFMGNGTDDILYRNNTNGDTGFYAIVNGVNTGWHDVGVSNTAYSVVGTGDYNGDGTSDILYRNNATGDTGFYAIIAGVNTGWHDVGVSNTAYHVVG